MPFAKQSVYGFVCVSADESWSGGGGRGICTTDCVGVYNISLEMNLHRPATPLNTEEQSCTDKKENQIFLIFKEIQNGAVAKSYMRKGFLIYSMGKSANI